MSKRRGKIIILIRLVFLWILSWIPFPGAGITLSISIERAYKHALNDYRNLKIDEKNAKMKEKGINLKDLNKKF